MRRLVEGLQPHRLVVTDESAKHAGHAGASPGGETHFHVEVEAAAFTGLGRIARQRMIYAVVGDLMGTPIHALTMRASAPDEA